ncbi:MAG: B12-binding domain-containing radical SAM protein [Nitrospira bacterium HGW-Nitrospira-1]|nr:MAG: B12-binding domain-containing radical SAM protein [Nitrospira bacterium HGW-Nitrospira-1]
MRCALVIPSWVPEDIFSSKTAGSQINYWQPLGTLYVAAVLQKAGHEVRFFNGAFMSHKQILAEIKQFDPGFIGIYSTTFGWKKAKKTAVDFREMFQRHVFICAGGPYPIAMQEKCLEGGGKPFDAIVCGEGEFTCLEILERLESGESLEGVKGVIYRDGERIIKNPERPLIADLDSLPFPARELLGDSNKYTPPPATYKRKPVAVLMTSRGCNRRCIYCFQIDKERKSGIRYRSVENVLTEIEHCIEQGYREIKFIDDTLAADYDRAMKFAKELKARKLDFTWFASACVNQVDKPLLQAFKDAGCWAILFGAESGVQKNLNTIRKGTTLEQIQKAVKAAQEVGLKVNTPFLFGIPGETFEEGLQTIDFAIELNPDMANFHAITPFPGTYLYDNLEKYGTMSDELTDFTYQGAAFIPYTMTKEDILRLRQIAFKRFYTRHSFILKKLLELRSPHDFAMALKSLRSLFWIWAKSDLFSKKDHEPPLFKS